MEKVLTGIAMLLIMVTLNSFTVPNALVQMVPELSEQNGLFEQKMLSETRDCCSKFATGLNIRIGIVQKV